MQINNVSDCLYGSSAVNVKDTDNDLVRVNENKKLCCTFPRTSQSFIGNLE
jgi:hypothetical protein